jgi:predicted dehydrogenase
MALTVKHCKRMIDASKRRKRFLQIAHCIRFWPEYMATREIIKSGKYGKVLAASFQRFSPMPSWNKTTWFTDEKRSGGMPLDLHVHDTDFIQHLFGMPQAVLSSADPKMSHIHTTFMYKNGPTVTAEANWRVAQSFGFKMSFMMTLEQATIIYDCTLKPSLKVYPVEGKPYTPKLASGDGYSLEIEHFAKKIAGKKVEDILTTKQSLDTVMLVLLEKESARRQRIMEATK